MRKLATFNIRAGMGMDGNFDIKRVSDKVSTIVADFIALQEVDKYLSRSNRIDEAQTIAEAANMYYEFAKAIDYDGGEYGVALLSKEKPMNVEKIPLPGREEARMLLICEFENIVVCCTHLSLTEADQIASVEVIKKALSNKYDKPIFIMGDFNAQSFSCVIKAFEESFDIISCTTKSTFPANKPEICIDYIMQLKDKRFDVKVSDEYVDNDREASDHLYVSVSVEV